MIGARHRFHSRSGIKKVYSAGQTARGPQLSLKFADREGRPYRVAVVVSRKVHKSAVARNRIRRRVYEAVRHTDERLLKNKDLVFTVFSDQVALIEWDKLTSMVEGLLKKAADKPSGSSQTPVNRAIVDKQRKQREA